MSDKLPQQSQNDEVDLGQLFNAIGKLFERLFQFIGNIFKSIFSGLIYALKPIVNNFKLIGSVVIIASILGFTSDKSLRKPIYQSTMLVKPYFESKYQLVNSIDYFNSLIGSKNIEKISDIFEIDSLSAKSLKGFDIEVGPETQDEILKQYDDYVKSTEVDSTMLTYLPYDIYVKNRDLLSSNIFSIRALSLKNDVFTSLQKGFEKILKNKHSVSLKKKSDEVYNVQKSTFEQQLARIDSIQKLYAEVRRKEAANNTLGFNGSTFPLAEDKAETKEYELFREEVRIRNQLRTLEQEKIEEKTDHYEVISGFKAIGTKEGLLKKHVILYPIIAFLFLVLFFISNRAFRFIKNYE
ncbi:hypothetical protein [Winogradskyella sp. PG-2]|uniref:hypothetical protein n=1 Tax=Winogradskyella sp. PG-2 TaxID=754409 RepID=UPI0004586516|nr:hypothetical protein [Winogradskyella sp. PG-2]BAO75571.1 hypothetical protein WPG_1341 [Winogradskyella sp. PG-2]